jgi:hypothetical protein
MSAISQSADRPQQGVCQSHNLKKPMLLDMQKAPRRREKSKAQRETIPVTSRQGSSQQSHQQVTPTAQRL